MTAHEEDGMDAEVKGCGERGRGWVASYSYAKDKDLREEKNHKRQRKGKEL